MRWGGGARVSLTGGDPILAVGDGRDSPRAALHDGTARPVGKNVARPIG
jgi:hypothetical protein